MTVLLGSNGGVVVTIAQPETLDLKLISLNYWIPYSSEVKGGREKVKDLLHDLGV